MNAWNLILATVVIFGTGVITGGLLVDHVEQPHAKASHHAAPVGVPVAAPASTNRPPVPRSTDLFNLHQPEILSQDFVQKLDDQLQFAPAQRDAIHKIIADGQCQNQALWTNWVGQSKQVLGEIRQHIREQLNPDQRKQFETILKQMHPAGHRTSSTGTNAMAMPATATNAVAPVATNVPAK